MHSPRDTDVLDRAFLRWGTGFLATGIILGAFGAHSLKAILEPVSLDSWKTAVLYQLIHGVGLLALHRNTAGVRHNVWMLRFLVTGVICFSGSIYLLTGAGELLPSWAKVVLGPVTPLGGLLMIGGWIFLFVNTFRQRK